MKGISRAENIIWREIGDEIAIVRDDGLKLYVLNKTAARIWKMCDGNYNSDEIAARLCESYDVSLEQAKSDVRNALAGMMEKGLLRPTNEVANI
jgi:hypothetical protein